MNIITIDCGASFVKGALYRDEKKIKNLKRTAPGASRIPLESSEKIRKLAELVKTIIEELSFEGTEFVLCISNEMHGFILADDKGEPLTDYISWQIDLGDRKLRDNPEIKEAICRTGMPVRGGLPSSNLSWIIQNISFGGKIYFYTLGDYLIRLISGKQPVIHPSNAAATGLFDITRSEWNNYLIRYIGAEAVAFPNISTDSIEFSLGGKSYSALPAIGDQQAALLGADFSESDTLSFNMGTGAQVSRLSDDISLDAGWQVRPYFFGKYLNTVPHIPSGRAINVYFRFIKSVLERYSVSVTDDDIWRGIADSINEGTDVELNMDLGFFENAINKSTKGSIENIGEFSLSIENLFLAIINQTADNACEAADRIWPDRNSVNKVLFTGGIAERFEILRSRISSCYKHAKVSLVAGDTLEGMKKYAELCHEG